jgi:hypothetical protein
MFADAASIVTFSPSTVARAQETSDERLIRSELFWELSQTHFDPTSLPAGGSNFR